MPALGHDRSAGYQAASGRFGTLGVSPLNWAELCRFVPRWRGCGERFLSRLPATVWLWTFTAFINARRPLGGQGLRWARGGRLPLSKARPPIGGFGKLGSERVGAGQRIS
jgi:hypothetical protein